MVREVVEDDPSVAGRLAWLGARLTIRPALAIGSHLANVPWPWGLVDFAARAATPVPVAFAPQFGCRIAPRDWSAPTVFCLPTAPGASCCTCTVVAS